MYLNKNFVLLIVLIIFLLIVESTKVGFNLNDGFYGQMKYIQENGFKFDLTMIHALRYIIMYPIIVFKNSQNYPILTIGIVIYLVPYYIFLKNNKNLTQNILLSLLLVVFLYAFSERTFVTILGGFYLFVYFFIIKNRYFFLYGFIFSMLSSGNLLLFIIYVVLFSGYIFGKKKILKLFSFSSIFFLFSFSLIHKYNYFLNQIDGLFSIITRSTLYTSYLHDQIVRFIFVSSYLMVIVFVIYLFVLHLRLTKNNVKLVLFLSVSLVAFLFEGITIYSYSLVLIYILMNNFKINKKRVNYV